MAFGDVFWWHDVQNTWFYFIGVDGLHHVWMGKMDGQKWARWLLLWRARRDSTLLYLAEPPAAPGGRLGPRRNARPRRAHVWGGRPWRARSHAETEERQREHRYTLLLSIWCCQRGMERRYFQENATFLICAWICFHNILHFDKKWQNTGFC